MTETLNPFVGPRPLGSGDSIFGRDQEIFELRNLLSSERIVVLHSPSGAGKSSLVSAGLIPQLKTRFDVWYPTRISLKPPPELKAVNRYTWSAAAGFEQEIPEKLRRPMESFADSSLQEYVNGRPRRPGAPKNVVLIFDQFEEILRVDPLNVDEKREFFRQLGDLLSEPRVWALFLLREDYLAPLDQYSRALPTYLKFRYRIDLLGLEAAADAIAKPAALAGREFSKEAVDQLLADLAAVKLQQPDGTFQVCTGLNVEPLQLQVVCRNLWDQVPANAAAILLEDVEKFGDTTKALSAYYANELTEISDGDATRERDLREWTENKLITKNGIRDLVMRGAGTSEGLPNDLIAELVDAHLVRAEQRGGTIWYELAHDRLIDPVRLDNATWRDSHLHQVQKIASLWETQEKPDGLLLTGPALRDGEHWARQNQAILTVTEKEFLAASAAKHRAEEKEKRQARRLRIVTTVATIGFVVAAIVAAYAFRQSKLAESRERAADAISQSDPTLAVILALSALQSFETRQAVEALEYTWQKVRGARFTGHLGNVNSIDWSKDGNLLVSGSDDGTVRLWDASTGNESGAPLLRLQDIAVQAVAFHPDSAEIAVAASDGSIRIVNRNAPSQSDAFAGCAASAMDVAFSSDGEALAAACGDNTVILWNRRTAKITAVLKGHSALVSSVRFDPTGKWLAGAGKDRKTTIWNTDNGQTQRVFQFGGAATGVAFSPDGRLIATSTLEGLLRVWRIGAEHPLFEPVAHFEGATSVDSSSDGELLATGGLTGDAKIWHAATGEDFLTLFSQSAARAHVRFRSSDAKTLAVASGEKIWLYDLDLKTLRSQAAQYIRQQKLTPRTQKECSQFFNSNTCPSF